MRRIAILTGAAGSISDARVRVLVQALGELGWLVTKRQLQTAQSRRRTRPIDEQGVSKFLTWKCLTGKLINSWDDLKGRRLSVPPGRRPDVYSSALCAFS